MSRKTILLALSFRSWRFAAIAAMLTALNTVPCEVAKADYDGQMITSGNWHDPANWINGLVASGPGRYADILPGVNATLVNDVVIGHLDFWGASSVGGHHELCLYSTTSASDIEVAPGTAASIDALLTGWSGSYPLGINKKGTGDLYLNNSANDFDSRLNLYAGKVFGATIANDGTACSFGRADGIWFHGGELVYTGPSASTDRYLDSDDGGGYLTVSDPNATLTHTSEVYDVSFLYKKGAGALALRGTLANDLSSLYVSEGKLILGKPAGIAAANSLTVGDGTGTDIVVNDANEQISQSVKMKTSGTWQLNGHTETISYFSGTGGVIENGHASSPASLIVNNSSDCSFTTQIRDGGAGTLAFTKDGVGDLNFYAASTHTGGTTVKGGKLVLGNHEYLADSSAVYITGGTLDVETTETVGQVVLASGAIEGGTLTASSFDLRSGSVAAALGGAVDLVKSTTGTVTVSGSNSYTGRTQILAGTLTLAGANERLPDQTPLEIAQNAVFNLNGFNETVGSLEGAGDVTLGAGALTIGANGNSTTFSGQISGTGALVKVGDGTQTLDGATSHLGGTTVDAGVLRGATDTLRGQIVNHATLEFHQDDDATFSGDIAGAGTLVKSGTGNLTVQKNLMAHTGPTHVNEGALLLPQGLTAPGNELLIDASGKVLAANYVNRAIRGGGELTASASLFVGDLSTSAGFNFDGTLDVGALTVVLLDADEAKLGAATTLATGGHLFGLNGLRLPSASHLTASGSAEINGDFLNQGTVNGPSVGALTFHDDVSGPGSYTGSVIFADGFSPGSSPAAVSLENFALDTTSLLTMELGGTIAGDEYDVLNFTGAGFLAGTLRVALINGFQPGSGESFDLLNGSITGTFNNLDLPTLSSELRWDTSQLYSSGVISVVPEPSTLLLLIAGGIGSLAWALTRRRLWVTPFLLLGTRNTRSPTITSRG